MIDFRGLPVLVTGHTGFKGAWLSEWLLGLGAKVHGVALPPESPESLFSALRLEERLSHTICDIRDVAPLIEAVRGADPAIVFHLAAQSLVLRSYRDPLMTWETNVTGTLNLLEAAKALARPVSVVVVTTDKVYKNREWEYAYREDDELGGHDPYSASKAACEIAVASWRKCFGSTDGVSVATARAGNVIGAGDWCEDRIVPDCFRAWRSAEPVYLRHPQSTRPWQHVLEPLSGYLALATHAHQRREPVDACNFGPAEGGHQTVEALVRKMADLDRGRRWIAAAPGVQHEARLLSLAIDRARHRLGWNPRLNFDETVRWTNEGYVVPRERLQSLIQNQLADYEARNTALENSDSAGLNG